MRVVVYWDLVFAFDFLVDYLLLFAAARLAGRDIARRRLLFGALLGASYAVAQLVIPCGFAALLPALALIGAAAYRGSGRALKLTLLFALSACGLAGIVLLVGQSLGGMARLARGVRSAQLPWGVFLLAGALAYVLLSVIFRDGAAHTGGEVAEAVLTCRGRTARVRLLRDTGNTLIDPRTGLGVPVIDRRALAGLVSAEETAALPRIAYCALGNSGRTLPLLHCEGFTLDGTSLGARTVALAEQPFSGAYAGLWCEGCGENETEGNDAQKTACETA